MSPSQSVGFSPRVFPEVTLGWSHNTSFSYCEDELNIPLEDIPSPSSANDRNSFIDHFLSYKGLLKYSVCRIFLPVVLTCLEPSLAMIWLPDLPLSLSQNSTSTISTSKKQLGEAVFFNSACSYLESLFKCLYMLVLSCSNLTVRCFLPINVHLTGVDLFNGRPGLCGGNPTHVPHFWMVSSNTAEKMLVIASLVGGFNPSEKY